jgi:hypothetical protein
MGEGPSASIRPVLPTINSDIKYSGWLYLGNRLACKHPTDWILFKRDMVLNFPMVEYYLELSYRIG